MSMKIGADYSSYSGYSNVRTDHRGDAAGTVSEKTGKASKDTEKTSKNEYVNDGVIYDKSEKTAEDPTYRINKMSASDRAAVAEQLKAGAKEHEEQLISIVNKAISEQAGAYGKATGDTIWTLLSGGKVNVSASDRAQARKDIGEDGYYGVKQTSQRLFDFASALAGDDVETMKKMQSAIEKGFKLATKSWGRELPGICKETFDATNKLFDEYYSKRNE